MRRTSIAWGAAAVLLWAAPAVAGGSSSSPLTGTWQGQAKCRFEGHPDEKIKIDVLLRIVAAGPGFVAAEMAAVEAPLDAQPLCGVAVAELEKPEKIAVSLNPFATFGSEPMSGPFPFQFLFHSVATNEKGKMKGRGIVIHSLTKGIIGACKLKLARVDVATPPLGKFQADCGVSP
ncbi:MAG TPA: hypothetical protein VEC57_15660 [Candidatus Limnocylindrales bacterium]|nr:hypothetical protein [Candidatus Limnocylindrales bacterium]